MVFQSVYVSSAAFDLSSKDIEQILVQARAHNEQNDLSGLLLFHDGDFIQVLEGERDRVEATLARIQKDSRHKGMIRLLERTIEAREFGDWRMGFISSDEIVREHHAFSDFLMTVGEPEVGGAGHALRLLQNFKNTRR